MNKLTREKFTKIFKAIGDPTRQKIMLLLRKNEDMNVTDIVKNIELTQPTISQHLKILKEAGVLTSRKAGQEVYYAVCDKKICNTMAEFVKTYDQRGKGTSNAYKD